MDTPYEGLCRVLPTDTYTVSTEWTGSPVPGFDEKTIVTFDMDEELGKRFHVRPESFFLVEFGRSMENGMAADMTAPAVGEVNGCPSCTEMNGLDGTTSFGWTENSVFWTEIDDSNVGSNLFSIEFNLRGGIESACSCANQDAEGVFCCFEEIIFCQAPG